MSEEVESTNDGTMSGLKKTIIGFVSTAVLTVGGFFVTKLTGGNEPAPAQQAAPVINITNSNQQAAAGKTVIINQKAADAKPAAPAKKKEGDEFKEKPAQW
jgi:hypothetical protein